MTVPDPSTPQRPLVVAIGNRFRSDDGVAGAVLDQLRSLPTVADRTDLLELDGEPTRVVDAWSQRRRAVMVDAAHAHGVPPGEVLVLVGDDAIDPSTVARWRSGVSGHSAGLAEALRLASVLHRLPDELCIVGVVAASVLHGTELSPAVAAAVPRATAEVLGHLGLGSSDAGGLAHVPL